MSTTKRYTVSDINNNRFYQLPKFLFEGDFKNSLCSDAKLLYALLRDRHDLSLQNNWINDRNEVYLIFTRKNMEDLLGISDKTVKKAVDQLKSQGLIEEECRGLNRPNQIYLTYLNVANKGIGESPIPESENLRFKNRRISDSRTGESPIQEQENLRPNDTNPNQTDFNHTDFDQSINREYQEQIDRTDNISYIHSQSQPNQFNNYNQVVHDNISYDYLKSKYPDEDLIDELTKLIIDVMVSTKKTERIGGENKPIDLVKSVFMKLNSMHIEYVINSLKENTTKAKNIRAYMLTSLYNSNSTINSYYTNRVNYDMNGID